ncbi:GDYXXLXY domain-containing protein [Pseudobacillus badius]|uniref:GDYXXLXY domain-containing protein n=1 Tax=Bacillus badius TaxID=1455 RepID=UPI0007B07D81|nr:GDYXXLXY domain-containing protein [Bacillus badius]KZN98148.1 hypothetical protein A4244_11245 [Bacillus badius]OCS82411.1 hypothetical protein A6M11_11255 [Bacillus badius]OVE50943.1 hypothetical protein B1A98_14105 [Bacillus badius]TDW01747.1 putative membrane-anchored protein [Bacillus badius]
MLLQKRGDIPYILGLVFLLAGVIYFFASNWPLLDRPVKIGLSMLMIAACFVISLMYKRSATFAYLSNWWLLASAIAFGAGVALVGQMYNSHADSYVLFLIWLIPVILLAVLTNYQPFFWLSFLLLELTIWLKIYPVGVRVDYSDAEEAFLYGALIVLHLLFFYLLTKARLEKIGFLALIVTQYCSVFLLVKHSLYHLFSDFAPSSVAYLALHGVYIFLIVRFWKSFMNDRKSHPFIMAVHLLFFGLYVVYNAFLIYIMMFGETVFFTGFLLLIAVFGFSVYVLQKLAKTAKEQDKKWSRYTYKFFVAVLSFLGTIIAILSTSSFAFLLFSDGEGLKYSFLFLGAALAVSGFFISKKEWVVVRLTLQVTGIAFLFLFAYWQGETWFFWLMTVLFLAMSILFSSLRDVLLYYLAANGALSSAALASLSDLGLSEEWMKLVFLLLGIFNAVLFAKRPGQRLGLLAYLLSLYYFFSLTAEDGQLVVLSILFHLIFAGYAYFHLAYPQSQSRLYKWATWIAVSAFLVWKYYEFIWKLLHKSLAFFIVSALFFLLFYWWGRKHTETARNIRQWSWRPIAILLTAQLAFIGIVSWQKEQLLQNGELVALQLEPLDPRSLLQGDYVQLNYAIHSAYQEEQQRRELPEGKLYVELQKTTESVPYHGTDIAIYQPVRFTEKEQPVLVDGKAVTIRGTSRYGNLNLGIEHFFIPENTGADWEEKNIALVRVAENGDAILETLVRRNKEQ